MATSPLDEFFQSADGMRLHYQWHQPVDVRGVVVVLHGYGDHAGRYSDLAHRLADYRIAVMGLDYRGHGTSDGQRGHCSQFGEYLVDLESACTLARKRLPGAPLGLVAHSHGSLIALRALCDDHYRACHAPAVVSSPYLRLRAPTPTLKAWIGHLASHVVPRLALGQGIPASDMTRDAEMLEANRRDRLIHHWATARWFTESLQAQQYVTEHVEDLRTPTLWLVAGADPVADPEVSLRAYKGAGGQKSLHLYEGCYHELFHEVCRERVFKDVGSWLAGRLLQG